MTKTILKILFIIALGIFQLTLFNKIMFFDTIPNIIIILAVAFVLFGRSQEGFLIAAIGGLMLDISSTMKFGIYTILFLIEIIFINFYLLKILPTPKIIIAFFIFTSAVLFNDLGIHLFLKMLPSWQVVISAFISGVWGCLIYIFLQNVIKPKEEIKIA
ncbi:MAG: Rod shape-determining protein MreD [Berkelbacteria bacterium GW2011_GWB1_38_5]|uniref:Rod shape-determining protein MreD n=2 Tax=Candidatus Berkelbacteria TaxID=1618330 RepID=A0A0G0LFP9_9BACT|nr:MAG: Rod shape-determining protein MreD [Berkelbacteria bacterium GW2011_GWB1_38_5]KKQ90678.1 MAG: Rod shape-determining protein MreD [Berkelbacteria bacterium GW2011_GWA1_39_10]